MITAGTRPRTLSVRPIAFLSPDRAFSQNLWLTMIEALSSGPERATASSTENVRPIRGFTPMTRK